MHVNRRILRLREQGLADFQFRCRSELTDGWDWKLLFRAIGGGVSRRLHRRLLRVTNVEAHLGYKDDRKQKFQTGEPSQVGTRLR